MSTKEFPYYKFWRKFFEIKFVKAGINIPELNDIRVTIIEMHCILERDIDEVIDKFLYGKNPDVDIISIKKSLQKLGMIRLLFKNKVDILRKIKKSQSFSIDFNFLVYLNELRNYVAHTVLFDDDRKVLYYKKKHLLKDNGMDGLIKDCHVAFTQLDEIRRLIKKSHCPPTAVELMAQHAKE